MADESTQGSAEQLLLQFGLDLSPLKAAASGIQDVLNKLNILADQTTAKGVSATSAQDAVLKSLNSSANEAVATAIKAISQEREKQAILATQTSELKKQLLEKKALSTADAESITASRAKKAESQAQTAEYQKQKAETMAITAELRKQRLEEQMKLQTERKEGGERGERGGLGLLTEKITSGIMGKGIAGSVVGGLLAGEGLIAVIEGAGTALERFLDKLKEVSVDAGNLVELQKVFDGLAKGAGVDATEMMNRLAEASEGMVSQLGLLKESTMALRSPFKLTTDQIVQLTHDVTVLSEASGHSAQQGIDTLTQAFARGRPMTLGMITGVAALRDAMRDLPTTLGPVERSAAEWNRVIKIMHDQTEALGDLPDTFEKMSTRMKVAMENAELSFGKAFNASDGIRIFYQVVNQASAALGGFDKAGAKAGEAVGSFLAAFAPVATQIGPVLGSIRDAIVSVAQAVEPILTAALGVGQEKTDGFIDSFKKAHPVIDIVGKAIIGMAQGVRSLAADIQYLGDVFKELSHGPFGDPNTPDPFDTWRDRLRKINAETKESIRNFETSGASGMAQGALEEETAAKLVSVDKEATVRIDAIKKERDEKLKTAKFNQASAAQLHAIEKKYDNDIHVQAVKNAFDLAAKKAKIIAQAHAQESSNIKAEYKARIDSLNKEIAQSGGLVPVDLIQKIASLKKQEDEALKNVSLEKYGSGGMKIPTPPGMSGSSLEAQQQEAQVHMQLVIAQAKLEMDQKKNAIKNLQAMDEENYDFQKESAEQHYANLRTIAAENYVVAIQDAKENEKAKIEQLKHEHAIGYITTKDYNDSVLLAQKTFQAASVQAATQYNQQMVHVTDEGLKDQQAAQLKIIEGALQHRQAMLKKQELGMKDVMQGGASADQYFTSQVQTIQGIAQAEIDAANQTAAVKKNTLQALQERANAVNRAIDVANQKLDDLLSSEAQVRLQVVQKAFEPQQRALEGQISFAQGQGNVPIAATQQLLQNIEQQRQALRDALATAQPYSDVWYQIYQHIEQTYQTQVKYNNELMKMQDYMQPVAGMFGDMAKHMGSIFHSQFAQNFAQTLGTASESMKSMHQNIMTAFGKQKVQKSPEQLKLEQEAASVMTPLKSGATDASSALSTFRDAVLNAVEALRTMSSPTNANVASQMMAQTHMVGPFQLPGAAPSGPETTSDIISGSFNSKGEFTSGGPKTSANSGTSGLQDKLATLTQRFQGAIDALAGFVSSITSAKSALAGIAGGGLSGMSMGSALSSALGMAGPWGAIAGGAIGAITGGITGQKNAQVQQQIRDFNNEYKNLMQTFQENTNNLEATIEQMQTLIANVEAEKAASKKGGQQYQQLIDQYTQELKSLQVQQLQTMRDMQTQLAILNTPLQGQSFLNSVDSILQQYDKFAGAAQNAHELAQANQFLSLSLQNLSTNFEQQFAQDEQNAINDALNLNNLLYQRTQLINNLNNSIQGILTQGSLTRQQTMAQKKGQQIEQLEAQNRQQMDQLNQEIAVTQMKVSAEQQIFNLATTRVGLETQLLQIQSVQTQQQMQQVAALQALVNALSAGNYNFTTLAALLAALGYPSAAQIAPSNGLITTGQPTPPLNPTNPINVPVGSGDSTTPAATAQMSNVMDILVGSAYSNRASMGFASFRGQGI